MNVFYAIINNKMMLYIGILQIEGSLILEWIISYTMT